MNRFWFYSLVFVLVILGWGLGGSTGLASVLFTGMAACFSYEGYRYNKEKFRLELFEKRWEVYESTIKFHEFVIKNRGLVTNLKESDNEEMRQAEKLAHECFFGIGGHRSKFLFGNDVRGNFNELENFFRDKAFEPSYGPYATDSYFGSEEGMTKLVSHQKFIEENLEKLFTLFSPYLYFGDYKYDQGEATNLCDLCALCSFKIKNLLNSKTRKDEI